MEHMKNKVRKSLTVLLTAGLLMGGCAFDDQIPDLKEDEMKMVEEYAAHLLLKYDENYKAAVLSSEAMQAERERLMRLAAVQVEIKKMEEERAAQEAQEKQDDSSSTDSPSDGEGGKKQSGPVFTDIDDFFGLDGLEIEYSGFLAAKAYPEQLDANDWQGVVTATTGNSLLVFRYTITNTAAEDKYLDMVSLSPRFTFRSMPTCSVC